LLYVPFDQNENTLKHNFPTREAAYIAYETTIHTNKSRFTYNGNPTWGDLESAVHDLENPDNVDETLTTIKQLELSMSPMTCKQICLILEHPPLKNVSFLDFKSQNILSLLKITNTTDLDNC
jgi:hypothetical protein